MPRPVLRSTLEAAFGSATYEAIEAPGPTPTQWSSVVKVMVGGRWYVLRHMLPSRTSRSDRVAEVAASREFARLGVSPEVHHADAEAGVILMEFVENATRSGAEIDADWLRALAAMLRAMHSTAWRPTQSLGDGKTEAALATIEARARNRSDLADYVEGLSRYREAKSRLGALTSSLLLCHNDLNPTNLLFARDRVLAIDLDHVGPADRFFDVATVAGACGLSPAQESALVELYLGRPPDSQETARLDLCRIACYLRYGLVTLSFVDDGYQVSDPAVRDGRPFVFDVRPGEDIGLAIVRLSYAFLSRGLSLA